MRLFAPAVDTWASRPLIGVTTSEMRRGDLATLRRHGEPSQPEMALGMTYLAAIERAGGLPVVLPPLPIEAVAPLLDRLDGVCLSGGPDLDPDAYGARERHGELGPTEPHLDAFELELARAADDRGLPLLGLCRGAQALNVARGGTLHQHLEGHRQAEPATVPTHAVTLALDSQVARIAGCTRFDVNSFHHQAVEALGAGLRIAGRAPDGTVEAIEDPSRPFVLGVQWHAETLVDRPAHLNLFTALVCAAAGSSRVLRAA
jgi:putative glutamine amidotransferase